MLALNNARERAGAQLYSRCTGNRSDPDGGNAAGNVIAPGLGAPKPSVAVGRARSGWSRCLRCGWNPPQKLRLEADIGGLDVEAADLRSDAATKVVAQRGARDASDDDRHPDHTALRRRSVWSGSLHPEQPIQVRPRSPGPHLGCCQRGRFRFRAGATSIPARSGLAAARVFRDGPLFAETAACSATTFRSPPSSWPSTA
jgi:hypothetical protein